MAMLTNYSEVMACLESAGYEAYLVGGYARAQAMKVDHDGDYDIATNARPEVITTLFEDSKHITGRFADVVEVQTSNSKVDVSTYSKGRDENECTIYADSIEEDLARRDATINAIAIDASGNIIDPYGGMDDGREGNITTIGDPVDTILAHPIRMMRYVRFEAEFSSHGLMMSIELEAAVMENAKLIELESPDAIREELLKGLAVRRWPGRYITMLNTVGLLEQILPDVYYMIDVKQNVYHDGSTVYEHTIEAINAGSNLELEPYAIFAVMLHDVGKPLSALYVSEEYGYSFIGHEVVGAQIASDICDGLNISKKNRSKIVHAIRWHMYRISSMRSARRFLARMPDEETAMFVLDVMHADRSATRRHINLLPDYKKGRTLVNELIADGNRPTVATLVVNGNDIMSELGIPQGPDVGDILSFLLEWIIDTPEVNTREKLLDLGKHWMSNNVQQATPASV